MSKEILPGILTTEDVCVIPDDVLAYFIRIMNKTMEVYFKSFFPTASLSGDPSDTKAAEKVKNLMVAYDQLITSKNDEDVRGALTTIKEVQVADISTITPSKDIMRIRNAIDLINDRATLLYDSSEEYFDKTICQMREAADAYDENVSNVVNKVANALCQRSKLFIKKQSADQDPSLLGRALRYKTKITNITSALNEAEKMQREYAGADPRSWRMF